MSTATQYEFLLFQTDKLSSSYARFIVYQKGDIVKDPMKSISFVPKTIPADGSSRSPLDRLSVDWHRSKRCIFIFIKKIYNLYGVSATTWYGIVI